MAHKPKYRRILLKLSGESLKGEGEFGLSHQACLRIAKDIKEICDLGVEIGIVIGGGNIFRGALAKEFGFSRTPADHIGMLATAINGLSLQQTLVKLGCPARVMSARPCDSVIETYDWHRANECLEKKEVVIFVGGTGNPYFTTDTAAALRASEIEADILLKATKVDGVYNVDPIANPEKATKYDELTYREALMNHLQVMDATAIALCRENGIPIYVFDLFSKGALVNAVCHGSGGSIIQGEKA